jgi:hypothetical protein
MHCNGYKRGREREGEREIERESAAMAEGDHGMIAMPDWGS